MEQWVRTWDHPCINAGVPGKTAQDAWYTESILMEYARLNNIDLAGAGVDIYKCFDQVLRPLLYKLLEEAGFPKRILQAYSNFMTNLLIHNMVAGSLGQPHRHPCGIPQGCPLSMMFIAFLLRPWIIMMRKADATPRILADDLLVFASGDGHESKFKNALKNERGQG